MDDVDPLQAPQQSGHEDEGDGGGDGENFSVEDIQAVANEAECGMAQAITALREVDGDVVDAVLLATKLTQLRAETRAKLFAMASDSSEDSDEGL